MLECACKTVYLNRPIYCGMKILDISKFHMFDVWYNVLKPEFGNRTKINNDGHRFAAIYSAWDD